MADSIAWNEGRIVRRTLPLEDFAEIHQSLECLTGSTWGLSRSGKWVPNKWEVVSQIVDEEDVSHVERGLAKDLREAKKLADRHVDELRKTWAAENGAKW